jgi:hypothetical protein
MGPANANTEGNPMQDKNPLVTALLCFTSATWVIAAPIIALNVDSFTPVWLGALIMIGTWILIIGVDQLAQARHPEPDPRIDTKVTLTGMTDAEIASTVTGWRDQP